MARRTGYLVTVVDDYLVASPGMMRTGVEGSMRPGMPLHLSDLEGNDGAPGADGAAGRDGVDGARGPAGADGVSPYAFAAKVTTASDGTAIVAFPTGKFTAPPVLSCDVEAAAAQSLTTQIVAGSVTKDGCVVKVWRQTVSLTVVLGLTALAQPASGAVVNVVAVAAT